MTGEIIGRLESREKVCAKEKFSLWVEKDNSFHGAAAAVGDDGRDVVLP